jgi:protein-disulfide isomerase
MSPAKTPASRSGGKPASKPRRSNRRLLVIGAPIAAIVVFAAVIIGVHLATSSSTSTKVDIANLQFVPNAKAEFAGIPSSGNTVGYANAPATVTEFGDLRCPICREFDSTVIPTVLTKLVRTHKAKLVYNHWPILGDNSVYANRAAYAAEQQNKLWEYALVVYYNQGDETQNWFTKAFAQAVATSIGLNMTQFDKDFDNTSASTAQVAKVNALANAHQFQGTPSVLVKGAKTTDDLGGATPNYSDIAKAVAKVTAAS